MDYFTYCQFCVFQNRCNLKHHELLGRPLEEFPNGCKGNIIIPTTRHDVLACQDCFEVIERPPEKGVCGKFNPNPIIPAGEFPPLYPRHSVVFR